MRRTIAVAVACAGVMLAGAARAQERYAVDGDRVAVYNLAGQMRVEAGGGSQVTVEVRRGGEDARQLTVRRSQSGGFSNLAIVYPGDRVVYPAMGRFSNTNLTVRPDGTFGDHGGGGWFGHGGVRVSGSGSGTRAWADVRVLVPAGRTVSVNQGVGRIDVVNVNGTLRVKGFASDIHASGTRGSVSLDTGSGGIELSDAVGDATLDTGSGGVRVTNVRGGVLSIDTGSGGVQGGGLAAQRLHVDVGSGAVRLDGVDARNIDVDSGSGSVSLRLTGDAEYLKVDTGSGGVTLAIPPSFGARAEIDTGSGGIHIEVPMTASRSTRDHFSGSFGDGNGRMIVDTGSGGVRVIRG
jgi:hypothetical protein